MGAETLRLVSPGTRKAGDDGSLGTFYLIRQWMSYLEVSGEANASTRRQYRRSMVAFLADVLLDLRDVTEQHVVDYLSSMSPRGSMRGYALRALKSFYRWAAVRELIPNDPTRYLKPGRTSLRPSPDAVGGGT